MMGSHRRIAAGSSLASRGDQLVDRHLAVLAHLGRVEPAYVDFTADAAAQAPLTWGQLNIWRPLQWFGEGSSDFNLRKAMSLGPGVPLTAMLDAWHRLVLRHQVLRTHFRETSDGPRQYVLEAGRYAVVVLDAEADADATSIAETAVNLLAADAFQLDEELPVRAVLVRANGLIRAAGITISHVAVDAWAMEQLLRELGDELAGTPTGAEPAWQPLDQVEYENSESGRRRERLSLGFWQRCLSEAPDRNAALTRPVEGDPIQRWWLDSTAVALAAQVIASRTRTSTSAVLLTVAALAHRALARRDTVALRLIAANRYNPRLRGMVAVAAQNAVLIYRPEGPDLFAAIRQTHRESSASYMRAAYNPDALDALIAEETKRRGTEPDLSAYFNDARLGREWTGPLPELDRSTLARLRTSSRLTTLDPLPKHDMSFYFMVTHAPDRVGLMLLADTRLLPVQRCRALLPALEQLLCEALFREVAVEEFRRLGDVEPGE
jgi:hypothetical protein